MPERKSLYKYVLLFLLLGIKGLMTVQLVYAKIHRFTRDIILNLRN